MNLDTFIHNLHFKTDKVNPPDWEVDWDDAPLPFKLYRNLPMFPLSLEVPLTLAEPKAPEQPDFHEIGHFLWYVFGLTQIFQLSFPKDFTKNMEDLKQLCRRFVPSGGALYPNELYVYLKIEDLPNGVYHYDVAHHRLILLREGNFDLYLTEALGERCDVSACFATVFVSVMFWKNFFKYHNFSYRLQGLDTGVLLGQLLEVAKRFGYESGVYFQFLDRAINHLLGLSEQEESVYAIIPLSANRETTWFANGNDTDRSISAAELVERLPAIHHNHYVRSKRVIEYPALLKMNEAAMMELTEAFRELKGETDSAREGQTVALPQERRLSYDLALASRKRFSPGMDFTLGHLSQLKLANLLQEATASFAYRNDLDGTQKHPKSRVSLYGCMYGVEGIPDGAYCYDSTAHTLRCMLVQRILLVSSALGIAGHPLLGFDVGLSDKVYKLDSQGKTSLIQIPVGPYNPPARLKGGGT